MTVEEVVDYLTMWADLNAREVYGSPREYINIYDLQAQLRQIKENAS